MVNNAFDVRVNPLVAIGLERPVSSAEAPKEKSRAPNDRCS